MSTSSMAEVGRDREREKREREREGQLPLRSSVLGAFGTADRGAAHTHGPGLFYSAARLGKKGRVSPHRKAGGGDHESGRS